MQLVWAGCLFGIGWISGRFERWGDEYLGLLLVAVAGSAIAISRGAYWPLFPAADPYSTADNLFFGMTPNQLAAVIVDGGAFLGGAIARKRRGQAQSIAKKGSVSATCDAYRRSRFAHCVIKNSSEGSIKLAYLEVLPLHGVLAIEWCKEGEVMRNAIKLQSLIAAGSSHTIEFKVNGDDIKNLGEIWMTYIDHDAATRRLAVKIIEKD